MPLALLNAARNATDTREHLPRELDADLETVHCPSGELPEDYCFDGAAVTGSRASVYPDGLATAGAVTRGNDQLCERRIERVLADMDAENDAGAREVKQLFDHPRRSSRMASGPEPGRPDGASADVGHADPSAPPPLPARRRPTAGRF